MENFTISSNTIKVCVGAGCKAWKSTEILSLIWEKIIQARGAKKLRVCATPCMKRCGGGATVQMPFNNNLFKFRDPEEAAQTMDLAMEYMGPRRKVSGGQLFSSRPGDRFPSEKALRPDITLSVTHDHNNPANRL